MADLRCRAGDLAIVTHSCNPAMLGRIVVVRSYRCDAGRWKVEAMGAPVLGTGFESGSPVLTRDWLFRDSSLQPLRGETSVSAEDRRVEEMHHG